MAVDDPVLVGQVGVEACRALPDATCRIRDILFDKMPDPGLFFLSCGSIEVIGVDSGLPVVKCHLETVAEVRLSVERVLFPRRTPTNCSGTSRESAMKHCAPART